MRRLVPAGVPAVAVIRKVIRETIVRSVPGILLAAWFGGCLSAGRLAAAEGEGESESESESESVTFREQIAPLLMEHCVACHQEKNPEGGYRIDRVGSVTTAGDSGEPPIVPGAAEASEMFRRMVTADVGERMPADNDPLPEEAIGLFREWIDAGASSDGFDADASLEAILPPPRHPTSPDSYAVALPITAVAFSPDGSELIVGGYHELLVWDLESAELRRRLGNVGQRIFAVAFPPVLDGGGDARGDGRGLVVASGTPGVRGEVRLVDYDTGETLGVAAMSADIATAIAFRPGHRQLAVGSADQKIRVVDLESMETILEIISHADGVTAVAWNGDGTRLASASRDRTVKLFDAEEGQLISSYRGHGGAIRGVAFTAEGTHLVSVDETGQLHRWGIDDAKVSHRADLGGEALRMSLASRGLLVTLADRRLVIVDPANLQTLNPLGPTGDWPLSAAEHPESGRIAVGGFDGEVSVWRAGEEQAIRRWIATP